jgi:ParB-like chromosome segregation protein Spo0J
MKKPKTAQTLQLSIEYRPIAELIPYTKNPRTHADAQVDQIVHSIKQFGWTNPILVDSTSGVMVAS